MKYFLGGSNIWEAFSVADGVPIDCHASSEARLINKSRGIRQIKTGPTKLSLLGMGNLGNRESQTVRAIEMDGYFFIAGLIVLGIPQDI